MKNNLLVLVALAAILSSCSTYRYIYTASPANNPYFTQKGQSKIAGYYSSNGQGIETDRADGYDLQGAYAISDRWAVIAGYYHRNERQTSIGGSLPVDSSLVTYKRHLFDIGTGYIVPLNEKRTTTFNIYGGFAWGEFAFNDENAGAAYRRFHKSAISKYYLQAAFNYMPNEIVYLSFLVKPSFVHYGSIKTDYTPNELGEFGLEAINNNTITFVDVGMNVQLGLPKYPWVKLDAILATSSRPYHFQDGLAVHTGNVSIGLSFDLSKIAGLRK